MFKSICCGRFCSTLSYGLWGVQMFMQCVYYVGSHSCNYVLILSMHAIHLYQCLFLIRCYGTLEFDNKFLFKSIKIKPMLENYPSISTHFDCGCNLNVAGYQMLDYFMFTACQILSI